MIYSVFGIFQGKHTALNKDDTQNVGNVLKFHMLGIAHVVENGISLMSNDSCLNDCVSLVYKNQSCTSFKGKYSNIKCLVFITGKCFICCSRCCASLNVKMTMDQLRDGIHTPTVLNESSVYRRSGFYPVNLRKERVYNLTNFHKCAITNWDEKAPFRVLFEHPSY